MNKYIVYTRQINADAFEIIAKDKDEALEKAKKLWNQNYGFEITSFEETIIPEKKFTSSELLDAINVAFPQDKRFSIVESAREHLLEELGIEDPDKRGTIND